MEISFNLRGNGACPLCKKNGRCPIHDRIKESLQEWQDPLRSGMELVVYVCPSFSEATFEEQS